MKFFIRAGLALAFAFTAIFTYAADGGSIRGVVTDPVGAAVSGATVELLRGSTKAAATTDNQGNFQLTAPAAGHYSLRASAAGFAAQESALLYVGAGKTARQDLALRIGGVSQQIVVSATGTATPDSRVGASVSVLTADQFSNRLDVLEPLQQIPGVQIMQNGQRGTAASMFLRGGNSTANKVLLDGIPLNDIGGVANFGTLAATGVDRIELLRVP